MGTMLISVGSAAIAATNAAAPSGFAPATLPEWITIALVLVGVAALLGMVLALNRIHDRMPKEQGIAKKEFVRMLCDQVWKHTDAITDVFAQRMRLEPLAIEQMRVLVRLLREDISAPANYVEQMRAHSTRDWPKLDLFQAFNNWGGLIKAMESQLSDLQTAINYPVVKEPVDKNRDERILHLYRTEQEILQRSVDKLRGNAFDLCAAAKVHLAKKKDKHSHDDEDDEAHADCPCCKRREGDHNIVRVAAPIQLPPMPPAPPAPPPAEKPAAAKTCVCVTPMICHCARCACSCACTPAIALPAPAKA